MADYGIVILAQMLERTDIALSASHLAISSGLPEPTVSKILKLMAKAGIIESVRGANGGYRFLGDPSVISVADIILAVDGPVLVAACVDGAAPDCSLGSTCCIRGRWDPVNAAIRKVLQEVMLTDMIVRTSSRTAMSSSLARAQDKEEAYGCY